MRLFICSMPLIALMMLIANYSYQQWDRVPLVGYDPRAKAIFQSHYKGEPKPEKLVVSMLLRED